MPCQMSGSAIEGAELFVKREGSTTEMRFMNRFFRANRRSDRCRLTLYSPKAVGNSEFANIAPDQCSFEKFLPVTRNI
jgi:hypothetical protein